MRCRSREEPRVGVQRRVGWKKPKGEGERQRHTKGRTERRVAGPAARSGAVAERWFLHLLFEEGGRERLIA